MADILYGRNAVLETLRAGRRKPRHMQIASHAQHAGSLKTIINLADQLGITITYVDRHRLDKQVSGANHQGVILETTGYPYVSLEACLTQAVERNEQNLLLIFDHIQDPQNIGTLIRTAEIIGIHGIIIPERRAALITPAVVNASSGATEHLHIAIVPNVAQTIRELQHNGIQVVGIEQDSRAKAYDSLKLDGSLALVLGAEGKGLARLTRDRCDLLLYLPMQGHISSLNAAVAGSIVLYHIWRQRTS